MKTENRPKKQLNTSKHKRKRIESLDDAEKKLRKLKRVKAQREEWGEIEEKGEVVKAWQPKKPRKSKKNLRVLGVPDGGKQLENMFGRDRKENSFR